MRCCFKPVRTNRCQLQMQSFLPGRRMPAFCSLSYPSLHPAKPLCTDAAAADVR